MHQSWNNFFTEEIKKEYEKIKEQIKKDGFFPSEKNILRFMDTDLNNVKVVIVGMEPYPSYYTENGIMKPEATGRSFVVASVKNWSQKFKQSSLRNILKTIYFNETGNNASIEQIRKEIVNGVFPMLQPKEWFDDLENQGVLFLNATLTVIPEHVDTHTKLWEKFMNALIIYIEKNTNVKWFLWGGKAQERILPLVDKNHCILTRHPRLPEFVVDNCFKEEKDIVWTGRKLSS